MATTHPSTAANLAIRLAPARKFERRDRPTIRLKSGKAVGSSGISQTVTANHFLDCAKATWLAKFVDKREINLMRVVSQHLKLHIT